MEPIKVPLDAPATSEEFVEYMKKLYPEATGEQLAKAWEEHVSMTLTDRIVKMMESYGETMVKEMEANFEVMIKEKAKEQEEALVKGIIRGLGIDQNPVVHLSDLEPTIRKILLESSDAGKRTQTSGDKPGEDNESKDPISDFGQTFDFKARFKAEHGGLN
jgi:Rod binding domain-containing protein